MSSRTPVNGVGYDPTLLASAPSITKADKQEGYNPDLLEDARSTPLPQSKRYSPTHPEDAKNGYRNGAPGAVVAPTAGSPTKPRSRKRLFIIIGIVAFLVVAIAVGVGVGVSVSKNRGGDSIAQSTGQAASTNLAPPNTSTTPKPVDAGSSGSSTSTGKPINTADTTLPDNGGVPGATAIPATSTADPNAPGSLPRPTK